MRVKVSHLLLLVSSISCSVSVEEGDDGLYRAQGGQTDLTAEDKGQPAETGEANASAITDIPHFSQSQHATSNRSMNGEPDQLDPASELLVAPASQDIGPENPPSPATLQQDDYITGELSESDAEAPSMAALSVCPSPVVTS